MSAKTTLREIDSICMEMLDDLIRLTETPEHLTNRDAALDLGSRAIRRVREIHLLARNELLEMGDRNMPTDPRKDRA